MSKRLTSVSPYTTSVGATGSEDIKKHKFFSSMNWEALFEKEIEPPFKPNVTGDDDVSNVAQEFLDEEVTDLDETEAPEINKAEQAEFDNFKNVSPPAPGP